MLRSLGGCFGRLLAVVLLALVVGVAWFNRDRLADAWQTLRGEETRSSPELAQQADEKLAALDGATGVTQVALNEAELQSLLEYRWAGFLPPDVVDPQVRLADGRVALEASVATARFGRIAELREYAAFLPDTTALRAVGTFVPLDDGHVALEVHELGAANIPVPRRLIPAILSRFPGSGGEGTRSNAVAVPLPPGVSNVFISGDSMVFVASRTPSE